MDHKLSNRPDTVEQHHVVQGEDLESPDMWDIYSAEVTLESLMWVGIDDPNDLPQDSRLWSPTNNELGNTRGERIVIRREDTE